MFELGQLRNVQMQAFDVSKTAVISLVLLNLTQK